MLLRFFCFCVLFGMIVFSMPLMSNESMSDSFRLRANKLIVDEWTSYDIDAEVLFGRKLSAKILGQYPMMDNSKLQRYINLLGQGIASMVGRPEINYYFLVVDSAHVNAYAAPGGYVFVTKGLVEKCQNEAQLMGVLAHEISHINRRYIVKKFNIRGKNASLLSDAGILVGGSTQTTRLTLQSVLDEAMTLLLSEGLDKEEELMADRDAVLYLSMLNYDWKSYSQLLMNLMTDDSHMSVSHTHPTSYERKKTIQSYVFQNDLTGENRRKNRFQEYAQI